MRRADSSDTRCRASAEAAAALSSEAADPFGEPTTLLDLEPELRRQFEFAEQLRQAIAETISGSLETGVGPLPARVAHALGT